MITLDILSLKKTILTASIMSLGFLVQPGQIQAENLVDIFPDETVDGSVELTPGYIAGTLNLGGQDISRIDLGATADEYSAKLYPTAEGPYKITVNVPQGSSLNYTLTGMAWMDNWQTRMFFKDRIELVEGENSIVTSATDISGNESTDNRSVSYEIPEPVAPQTVGLLDIKPGSCKNPFNVSSKGVLPVVLLGSSTLDVTAIDPLTITVEGIAPLRYDVDDVAAPDVTENCDTDQSDGYDDLVLKFNSQAIVAIAGSINDGDVINLGFNALTYDGADIAAEDHVTIIKKGKGKK